MITGRPNRDVKKLLFVEIEVNGIRKARGDLPQDLVTVSGWIGQWFYFQYQPTHIDEEDAKNGKDECQVKECL